MNGKYVIVNDGDQNGEEIILVVNDDQFTLLEKLSEYDIITLKEPDIEDLTT